MLSINKNLKIKNELRHEPKKKKKERKKVKYYNSDGRKKFLGTLGV